jgi:ribonuclease Z
MNIEEWNYAGLNFNGLSLAGVRTSLTLPQYSLAFDVGQGLPHAIGMNTFLISHGHMDHASGIPYIISQKAMQSHKLARFIMPESMVQPMTEIMNQWTKIEGFEYEYEFIASKPNQEFELKPNLVIRTFPTLHRVPSQGYSIYRKYRKLRSDLVGLPSEEIAKVRERGEEPTEEKLQLMVSFTGDTQIEFLDMAPEVRHSKILMVEATYLDERKTIASAKEWGHIHLDELIPRLETITSERIVLIHTSARYSMDEAIRLVQKRLPPHERERVVIYPGR